ncbi:MAG: hypothetical protein ACR2MU_00675 [Gaiellaceae bacterium]
MRRVLAIALFLGALLAIDQHVTRTEQLGLGAATWVALVLALRPLDAERRLQALVVVGAATIAEVTGSLLWGVYHYRLGNLPTFIPPAHGLVYLAGLALARALAGRERQLVVVAAAGALLWGALGLTVLPREDLAGAAGVPLLLVFLAFSRSRPVYAGVFLVVAALELYGTAIGTWRWSETLPGLEIPDGTPPSGVASGYVCFDVAALYLVPRLRAAFQRR